MKLLVDMNLSPKWVDKLRSLGIEALHWSAIGPGNATDREIMAYARGAGCIVLTHDLDFGNILAGRDRRGAPSVVQIRSENVSPDAIGDAVVAALRQMENELEAGALVTVNPRRTRLRLLPLRTKE